jgi:TonB family protein
VLTDKLYSIIVTLFFHLVVLLLLKITVLQTSVPHGEESIIVNFGDINASAGTFEPQKPEEVPPPPPETVLPTPVPPQPQPLPLIGKPEELITQNIEETVALENEKNLEERRKEEEQKRKIEEQRLAAEAQQRKEEEERKLAVEAQKRKEEEERKLRAAEEERKRRQAEADRQRRAEEEAKRAEERKRSEAISKRVAAALAVRPPGAGQNAVSGAGNQGSISGNPGQDKKDLMPGFNLNGRYPAGEGGLPSPEYSVQEEGTIVVSIIVNPNGDVIFAEIKIGQLGGTNIDNASMRQSALSAAKRAKFNRIAGTTNQSGTITYKYRLTQ